LKFVHLGIELKQVIIENPDILAGGAPEKQGDEPEEDSPVKPVLSSHTDSFLL
jgi:hypothetical protein